MHPISNLIDLKRRLGVGRRCFGYLHPAIPGWKFVSMLLFIVVVSLSVVFGFSSIVTCFILVVFVLWQFCCYAS